jgi:uncharacterized membrane protein YdjX (TVP38/TMEM64 family)
LPAALVLFPRPLITLFAVVAFGPLFGFAYAYTGILVAAAATFWLGLKMDRNTVRRIAGVRLDRIARVMRLRGALAMTAVRLVPLGPFAVVNIVAGAIRIRLRDFLIGSAIGILPGTLVATVFGDQLVEGLRDPRAMNVWLILGMVVILGAGTLAVRRWLLGSQQVHEAVRAPTS